MLLSKKVQDTQTNPRYSAKNTNDRLMIASFMPIDSPYSKLFSQAAQTPNKYHNINIQTICLSTKLLPLLS